MHEVLDELFGFPNLFFARIGANVLRALMKRIDSSTEYCLWLNLYTKSSGTSFAARIQTKEFVDACLKSLTSKTIVEFYLTET